MRIAIDAGHGPNTAGKRSPDGSLREFQFNSVVARYVRDGLLQYEGIDILFTHADDGSRDVPLQERTDKANAWKADVFVSIHANAMGTDWNTAEGIETFVYTSRPTGAVKLAEAVHQNLLMETGLKNRGVKAEDFHVLRETHMTAILVECGFMTNKRECELLKSDEYRRKCAKAIVNGIVEVYGLKKKMERRPDGYPPGTPQYKKDAVEYLYQTGALSDPAWRKTPDAPVTLWMLGDILRDMK